MSEDLLSSVPDLPRTGVATEVLRQIVPPLPVARRTRILVVGCGVKMHFPWDAACARYDRAVAAITDALDPAAFEILRAPEPFEDPDALLPFCDGLLAGGLDGVVLFHASSVSP